MISGFTMKSLSFLFFARCIFVLDAEDFTSIGEIFFL